MMHPIICQNCIYRLNKYCAKVNVFIPRKVHKGEITVPCKGEYFKSA